MGNTLCAYLDISPFTGFNAGSERFCFVSRLQVGGESKTAHVLKGGAITQVSTPEKKKRKCFPPKHHAYKFWMSLNLRDFILDASQTECLIPERASYSNTSKTA